MHGATSAVCRGVLRASRRSCTQRWPVEWVSETAVADREALAGVGEPAEMFVARDLFGEIRAVHRPSFVTSLTWSHPDKAP